VQLLPGWKYREMLTQLISSTNIVLLANVYSFNDIGKLQAGSS
jgi:hypothetical protein